MAKHTKKIRVFGQQRPELDTARFADALVALALHQLGKHDDEKSPGRKPETETKA